MAEKPDSDAMTPEESGREGGLARAQNLSPEERKEIAAKAARARWAANDNKLPKATHAGPWRVGDLEIQCAVLDDGTRVLTQQGVLVALGRARSAKGGQGASVGVDDVPAFLAASNLKRYISDELLASTKPIVFINKTGARSFGYRAEILADICWVFINAQLEKKLVHTQAATSRSCARGDTSMRTGRGSRYAPTVGSSTRPPTGSIRRFRRSTQRPPAICI
jgi:hypothetical protein